MREFKKIKKLHVLLVMMVFIACNREQRFEVAGTISNASGEKIYLEGVILNNVEVLDSTKLGKSGKFKFKARTNQAGFYQLRVNNKTISLIIEPGDEVYIESGYGDLPLHYSVEGSDGSMLVQKLNSKMTKTKHDLDSLETLYIEISEVNPDAPILDSLSRKYDEILEAQKRHNIIFILNFYDNLASLYALYQKTDNETYLFNKTRDIQYYKILADSLNKYHPDVAQVKALRNNTKDLIANLNSQRAMKLVEGVEPSVPEIALPNTEQDTIRLSGLKGNVVLLSFWASWNAESISENIRLLDIYNKYHRKGFEIYQVSLDKTYENWTKSIRFNELPWINVSDLSYPNSFTAKVYNIQELPTHFLLNRKQDEIIGRNMTLAELDRKLSVMLN